MSFLPVTQELTRLERVLQALISTRVRLLEATLLGVAGYTLVFDKHD